MKGSYPRSTYMDDDKIGDLLEFHFKSNITGIEVSPPQIENVARNVGIAWDWWGFLYLPMKATVTVSFKVTDNVGLDKVTVTFYRMWRTVAEVRTTTFRVSAPYDTEKTITEVFEFSIFDALAAGAD